MLSWLLPYNCIFCHKLSTQARDICHACEQELPWTDQVCVQCGIKLTQPTNTTVKCGQCLSKPPAFDRVISAFEYAPPIDNAILQFKFKRELANGRVMTELLADKLVTAFQQKNTIKPQLLVPVPLHWWRHTLRGYNQATLIGKILSRKLNIPLSTQLVKRKKFTLPQRLLTQSERITNIKHAFALRKNTEKILRSQPHIALIDDVITTGNTAQAIARLFKKAGAKTVCVYAIARVNYQINNQ